MGTPSLAGLSGTDKAASDRATAVISGTITAVGPCKAFSAWGPMNLVIWGQRTTTLATTAGSASATVGSATGIAAGDSINSPNVPPGTTAGGISSTTVTLAFMPQAWSGTLANGVAAITDVADVTGTLPNGKSISTLVGATILNSPYFAAGTTVLNVGPDGRSLHTSTAPSGVLPGNQATVLTWFAPTANAVTVTGTDAAAVFTSGAASNYNATIQIERAADGGATWLACNVGGSGQIAIFSTNQVVSLAFGDPEASMLYRLNCTAFSAVSGVALNYRISATGQASTSLSVPAIM